MNPFILLTPSIYLSLSIRAVFLLVPPLFYRPAVNNWTYKYIRILFLLSGNL